MEVQRSGYSARNGECHLNGLKYSELKVIPLRTLRRGKHRLLLWPGIEADGSVESMTPSKLAVQDEMGRLEKVRSVCWLHSLSLF